MSQTNIERVSEREQARRQTKPLPQAKASALAHKRGLRQSALWWILPAIIVAGWWYPILGFFVPACMFAAWGIAAVRGRSWCDWMCPRGAFSDSVLSRVSTKRGIPAVLRSTGFRIVMLLVLMTVLALRLPQAWPDPNRIGLVFVMLLTVTTGVAILVGILFHPRTWCLFCPAGTVSNWIGRGRAPQLLIRDNLCTECKRCFEVCPVELRPFAHRSNGVVADADCIKCGLCVETCASRALGWRQKREEARA